MTPFQKHVLKWKNCQRCDLCHGRTQVVIARGQLPCDILFIGEAPGISEDVLGQPFKGPAGKLMDQIINRAFPGHIELAEDGWTENWILEVRIAFTNLVGCFPKEQKEEGINEPPDEAIKACAPRLQEIVKLADPKLIVCVGNLSRDWLDTKWKGHIKLHCEIPMVAVTHPAAILRGNIAAQSLLIQKSVITIQNAVEDICQLS